MEQILKQTLQVVGRKFGIEQQQAFQRQVNTMKSQIGEVQRVFEFHERQRQQMSDMKLASSMQMDNVDEEIRLEDKLTQESRLILLQAYGLQDSYDDQELEAVAERAGCSKQLAYRFFQQLRQQNQGFLKDVNSKKQIIQQQQMAPQNLTLTETKIPAPQTPPPSPQVQSSPAQNTKAAVGINSYTSGDLPVLNKQREEQSQMEVDDSNQQRSQANIDGNITNQSRSYQAHIEAKVTKLQRLMRDQKFGAGSKYGTIFMWMQYEANSEVRLIQFQALAQLPSDTIVDQLEANAANFFELMEKWIRGAAERSDGKFLGSILQTILSMPIKKNVVPPSFVKFVQKAMTMNTFESLVDLFDGLLNKIQREQSKEMPTAKLERFKAKAVEIPKVKESQIQNPIQQELVEEELQIESTLNSKMNSVPTAQAVTEGTKGPLARGAAVRVKSQKDKPLTADEIIKRNRIKRLSKQITQQANKKVKTTPTPSVPTSLPPAILPQQKTLVAPPPDASPEEHFEYFKQQKQKIKLETSQWERQQVQYSLRHMQFMRPQQNWYCPKRSNMSNTTFGYDSIEAGVQQTRCACQPAFVSGDPSGICFPREPTSNISQTLLQNPIQIPFVPRFAITGQSCDSTYTYRGQIHSGCIDRAGREQCEVKGIFYDCQPLDNMQVAFNVSQPQQVSPTDVTSPSPSQNISQLPPASRATVEGRQCVFPFYYRGIAYLDCVMIAGQDRCRIDDDWQICAPQSESMDNGSLSGTELQLRETDDGRYCQFPFSYGGELYYDCVYVAATEKCRLDNEWVTCLSSSSEEMKTSSSEEMKTSSSEEMKTSSSEETKKSSSTKLSGGAIAAIAIAILLVLVLTVLGTIFYLSKSKLNRQQFAVLRDDNPNKSSSVTENQQINHLDNGDVELTTVSEEERQKTSGKLPKAFV
eukprot:TRINITY_DN3482_c0_g1_i12.p1 TRINITY_DN3482_c0_g1~~TRINITY_DN3482_c0_g1_i12.p1  ORF type:complete len:1001 (+),score=118.12 TRINITY_DN3482_c0_g1_i12:229-3003(+)